MDKIKINKKADEIIIVVSGIAQMNGITSQEILDNIMEEYKKTEGKKLFTADETDSIMQVLESMPGYTPEKFLTACVEINDIDIDEDNKAKVFQWALYFTYIMLSITNPELFEDYKEEDSNGSSF